VSLCFQMAKSCRHQNVNKFAIGSGAFFIFKGAPFQPYRSVCQRSAASSFSNVFCHPCAFASCIKLLQGSSRSSRKVQLLTLTAGLCFQPLSRILVAVSNTHYAPFVDAEQSYNSLPNKSVISVNLPCPCFHLLLQSSMHVHLQDKSQ